MSEIYTIHSFLVQTSSLLSGKPFAVALGQPAAPWGSFQCCSALQQLYELRYFQIKFPSS